MGWLKFVEPRIWTQVSAPMWKGYLRRRYPPQAHLLAPDLIGDQPKREGTDDGSDVGVASTLCNLVSFLPACAMLA